MKCPQREESLIFREASHSNKLLLIVEARLAKKTFHPTKIVVSAKLSLTFLLLQLTKKNLPRIKAHLQTLIYVILPGLHLNTPISTPVVNQTIISSLQIS